MKLAVIVVASVLGLSGCVNLGLDGGGKDAPEIVYHVLEDAGRRPVTSPSLPVERVLVLVDTNAGAFYDTDGIAFSKQPGTRGYYQFARWSERAGKRFSDLLLSRLELEKTYSVVASTSNNVRGDLLLTTDIVELFHDANQQPGLAILEMRAELVDLKTRSLVARKTFKQSVAVNSYDAAGAHKAFNQATTQTLNEMLDWLKTLPR